MMTYAEMSKATRPELEKEVTRAEDRVDELKERFEFLKGHGFDSEAHLTRRAIDAGRKYLLLLNWALKAK